MLGSAVPALWCQCTWPWASPLESCPLAALLRDTLISQHTGPSQPDPLCCWAAEIMTPLVPS